MTDVPPVEPEDREDPEDRAAAAQSLDPAAADELSAMAPRFNFLFRGFAKRFFGHFDLDDETVERLRGLESRGAVVYVMRYSSRLDYFLFNALFRREGLRLSRFANGLNFYYYRPFIEAIRIALFRKRGRPHELRRAEEQEAVRRLVAEGQSIFLFLRTARLRSWLRGRRSPPSQDELGAIRQLVRDNWDSEREVHLVPLALFWRKGPRTESRFLNLSYGALTRPSDLAKVSSFLATYRDLSVKCGDAVNLRHFIDERREEGPHRVARKVRRAILLYLYGEEKVVEGPTVRPPHRVWNELRGDSKIQAALDRRVVEKSISSERAMLDAEGMFREIAANMDSTVLALAAVTVGWIFRRMFADIDVTGLERIVQAAKRHPIVLVPNHRSYFDFLILSWLFYQRFMVPPHIVARENMAFGPFGFLFRRVGAFFMRKNLDDPLYKEVFRAYVSYLVREGFTQEFFIEGGRSRTGKMLAPRFGVLSWDVEGFLDSGRRDLLFVPVAISYERLVEESAMIDELEGGEKTQESVLALVRARRFLRSRFGSVHLRFGEPLSLADAMGERIERFRDTEDGEIQREKRNFVEGFGNRLVEAINAEIVVNATSVAAAVLLGTAHRGLLREDLVQRMEWVVELLQAQGVRLSAALERDRSENFAESIAFLASSSLVEIKADPRGEIVFFAESRRRALDIYRNAIAHSLATPSALAHGVLGGVTQKQLREDLEAWRVTLYQEHYQAGGDEAARTGEVLFDLFSHRGWVEELDGQWIAAANARPFLRSLAEQTQGVLEAYAAVVRGVAGIDFGVHGEASSARDRKLLLKEAQTAFERAELLGEATRREAANDTVFGNAIDWLVREGVLEPVRADSGVTYAPGERFATLEALERRLAAEIGDR